MNNIMKKSILLILILIILIIGINIITSVKETKYSEFETGTINSGNAKTLQIDNNKITNLSDRTGNDVTAMTKIKNISKLNLSQIVLFYDELDKNDNVISKSKIDIDITLSPNDTMQVQFTPKDYTDSIEITGYTYLAEDCSVVVNLKDNEIKTYENNKYLENSKNYDVMSINKDNNRSKQDDLNFTIEIENISDKNLGNIVLKVAEIDQNKEIVRVDHIIYNSILKPEQKDKIVSSLYDSNYDIKILGYTYDDMENKSNVDIDLITKKVNIVENGQ
ncbi:hypothetical protein [Terrisporobacter mayombei]|uniref:CARDB domain-containing protein n=1 Tax=Terrisporobacter mayombei TaxID=1541 RepID=A0ABY9PZM4_9FIRM|nr:hypothetical protein [Terrisporobacter mayombei]MCC3868348.1 hypothetical protein [Terrisporobacter mayombei]WMT80490.1 hypothetical protein TEMA_08070 [Terrisporobacter mayombei]